ncbi:MAG: PAS domain-containing protein [Gemmatimonadota bacterium]|nr:MAG: PAS domain-containing protein [Gemmatimonadota bacterium]
MRWMMGRTRPRGAPRQTVGGIPSPRGILRWIYLGRVTVAIVVFVAAAVYFAAVPPETILILAIAAILSVVVTSLSAWYTHVRGAEPGVTFLYSQALFDLGLVTTVVHVTEGPASQFPALYILVIAVAAVVMPLGSSLLITALASLLYLADIIWWQPVQLSVAVWLQIAVFVAVFTATGLIASRVRVVGAEREILQREVRRLTLEAADILRNITSGVVTVDGDGRVLYANPAAVELLNLQGPMIRGERLKDVVGVSAPELLQTIALTQSGGQRTLRAEGKVSVGDRRFPIGVTTTSIDDGGARPSVTAIFTDISDQKRLEEMHLRTERLEAVAELSASLAHEIKNPLASIRSSIEQLGDAAQDEEEQFLVQLVVRESDRLSRLLTEFLDFSRVRVTDSRELDLGAVAEKAADVVRNHPDCGDGAVIEVIRRPAFLEGDEDLLHRVIVNLALNAVQASDGHGRVTIEVREARPDELPRGLPMGRAVLLKVSDEGPGIPKDLAERLFEPFVSGRTGGSGLGLAIAQRAVEAHRGVILVESMPGEGTAFSVVLPSGGTTEETA